MAHKNLHRKHHHAITSHAQTFINSAAVSAQQSELLTGVPASITLAQAAIESGWGKHHIGKANNYFGIKAFNASNGTVNTGSIAKNYVDVRTREHLHGEDIIITDHFRKYDNMTDSFTDHGLFLRQNNRYHQALENYAQTGNADDFAHGLQAAGYATDPNYAHLLIKVMKKYNLYQYNNKHKHSLA